MRFAMDTYIHNVAGCIGLVAARNIYDYHHRGVYLVQRISESIGVVFKVKRVYMYLLVCVRLDQYLVLYIEKMQRAI